MSEIIQIPKGWQFKKLEELVQSKKGKKPSNIFSEKKNDSLPYVNIKAFEKNIINFYGKKNDGVVCQKNDVLVVWDGARSGLVGIGISGLVGSTIVSLKCSELIFPMYLFYFLKSKYNLINTNPRGDRIPHVKQDLFWNLSIPLPSLQTQKKIVQKLDDVLGQLEEKIKQILEIKLTLISKCDFLKKNYQSILAESLLNYEDFQKKNSTKKIGELLDTKLQGFYYNKGYVKEGIPLLRITDMNDDGKIIYENIPKINATRKEYERYLLQPGDLVMARTGASRGRMVVFNRKNYDLIFAGYLIRFRFKKGTNPHFIQICFKHPTIKKKLLYTSHGGATKNINAENLKQIAVPLLSEKDQNQLVTKFNEGLKPMEKFIAKIDKIVENQTNLIQLTTKINTSILDTAFSGKLVQ